MTTRHPLYNCEIGWGFIENTSEHQYFIWWPDKLRDSIPYKTLAEAVAHFDRASFKSAKNMRKPLCAEDLEDDA